MVGSLVGSSPVYGDSVTDGVRIKEFVLNHRKDAGSGAELFTLFATRGDVPILPLILRPTGRGRSYQFYFEFLIELARRIHSRNPHPARPPLLHISSDNDVVVLRAIKKLTNDNQFNLFRGDLISLHPPFFFPDAPLQPISSSSLIRRTTSSCSQTL